VALPLEVGIVGGAGSALPPDAHAPTKADLGCWFFEEKRAHIKRKEKARPRILNYLLGADCIR